MPIQAQPSRFINPPSLPRSVGYSQVAEIASGKTIYISGQVALDPTGLLVGPNDVRAQAQQVFENLKAALEAAGADFNQVVKLNYYLVDILQMPIVREVRDQFLNTQSPPTSTAVEVRRLVREEWLIEVDAVAVIPG